MYNVLFQYLTQEKLCDAEIVLCNTVYKPVELYIEQKQLCR